MVCLKIAYTARGHYVLRAAIKIIEAEKPIGRMARGLLYSLLVIPSTKPAIDTVIPISIALFKAARSVAPTMEHSHHSLLYAQGTIAV